jgi:hypothetical protein
VLDRPRQRRGARIEHQDAGAVLVDQLAGHHRVGGVRGHRRERLAQLCAQFLQCAAVPGDPDDLRARSGQGGSDATAKAPAGAGDQRRHSCYRMVWHDDPP